MEETRIDQQRLILAGKRIGVFGKGGSGKSTAVILLAQGLRERGYEVCVLDADSTNIGLPNALGIDQAPRPLLDYFGGMVFSGGLVTCPVDNPTRLPESEIDLDELPPQYYRQNPAGITLLVAGKIGDQGPGAGCDGPIAKIARDVRLSRDGETPLTLVDFKAGFEDSARGAITSLDWAIVLVDPTTAAVEMAVNLRDMVAQIKSGTLPATRHLESPDLVAIANELFLGARIKGVLVLLNKIDDAETEDYLRTKLAERGIEPGGVIHEDPSSSVSWLKGTPLEVKKSPDDLSGFIRALEAAESRYAAQSDLAPIEG